MFEAFVASPANVVRAVLIGGGFGVMPGIRQIDPTATMMVDLPQVFTSGAPDDLNLAVLLKDVAGVSFGRLVNGRRQQQPGVNVQVRHPNEEGFTLCVAIEEYLANLVNLSVTIGRYSYKIQNIRQGRPITLLGEDKEKARLAWTFELFVVFCDPPRTDLEEE